MFTHILIAILSSVATIAIWELAKMELEIMKYQKEAKAKQFKQELVDAIITQLKQGEKNETAKVAG